MTDDARDFELCTDGTVRVVIGDTTHRLRRPTIGEVRKLTEGYHRISDELVRFTQNNQRINEAIAKANEAVSTKPTDKNVDAALAARADQRKANEDFEALGVDWHRDAMIMLSDHADDVPPGDGLPAYMVHQSNALSLLNHWRSVPLAPGDA